MKDRGIKDTHTDSQSVVLRAGPHEDIVECVFFDVDIEEDWDPSTAVSIGDLVKAALISETAEQRVRAAKSAIEQAPECAVAWLVVAREGCSSVEDAKDAVAKAMIFLKEEADADEDDVDSELGYCISHQTFALAVADMARLMFDRDQQGEAIEMLTRIREDLRENGFNHGAELRDLAVSFLIRSGKIQEAQEQLLADSGYEAEWHYLNALLRFSLTGDCLLSRSALAAALDNAGVIGEKLVQPDDQVVTDLVDYLNFKNFVADLEPAWHKIPGALDWLKRTVDDPYTEFNRGSVQTATTKNDASRWKRMKDLYERAERHLENDDVGEAKKLLKSALREAERVDYAAEMFHRAIYELIHVAIETDEPLDELRERVMERAKRLCDVPAENQPLHAFHCQSAGELLSCIGDFESSAKYLVQAVAELESCSDSIPAITLHDVTKARQEYAVALFRLAKYEESIKVASKLIEQQESYLGPDSPELTDGLETLYMSLRHASHDKLAGSVYERIEKLDHTHFASYDTRYVCKICCVEHADSFTRDMIPDEMFPDPED